ncbi:MAG: hypothetical protein AB7O32_16535 [Vicinamibacterales bacterium]
MASLVRTGPEEDGLADLRSRLTELEAALGQRTTEVARVRSALDAFRVRYRHEVGLLHERLDELEIAIAEAELGEISKRLKDAGAAAPTSAPAGAPVDAAPRLTSDAVRRLFRDVAKAIHPDLAPDEHTRHRRHALMIEANKAYALGDEEQLRWILQAWERSPEAVPGHDPDAARLRLERRVAQIEEQLEMVAADLAELKDTPLWKLKALVDEAAARGKDLVRDMVRRLKRDIMVAENRLNALRPPS